MTQRNVLLIYAHPDDETFSAAGTICRYREQEVEINLICTTRGDKGKTGEPPICTEGELPAVREQELRRVAEMLGIRHTHIFDYEDEKLHEADAEKMREQLVHLIRLYRPDIVVTFDPNGENLHPDHIAISRFVFDALAAAVDERWYPQTGTAHHTKRLLWTTPKSFADVARQANPAQEPGVDFLLDISRWSERKAAALRAHRSQNIDINKLFFDQPDTNRILSIETFRLGQGVPLAAHPADDLFADMD